MKGREKKIEMFNEEMSRKLLMLNVKKKASISSHLAEKERREYSVKFMSLFVSFLCKKEENLCCLLANRKHEVSDKLFSDWGTIISY